VKPANGMGKLKKAQIILIFMYSSETCKWNGQSKKGTNNTYIHVFK
jgi:hypothetical protein